MSLQRTLLLSFLVLSALLVGIANSASVGIKIKGIIEDPNVPASCIGRMLLEHLEQNVAEYPIFTQLIRQAPQGTEVATLFNTLRSINAKGCAEALHLFSAGIVPAHPILSHPSYHYQPAAMLEPWDWINLEWFVKRESLTFLESQFSVIAEYYKVDNSDRLFDLFERVGAAFSETPSFKYMREFLQLLGKDNV